jgi:hypothetical protein
MFVRRLAVISGSTLTLIVLSAGSASAHFCYFNDPNSNAQAGRAGSQGFVTFEALATEFTGLCTAGIQVLADAAGVELDTLINAHGVMAGPTDGNKAISHLDFEALDAAGPDAAKACS